MLKVQAQNNSGGRFHLHTLCLLWLLLNLPGLSSLVVTEQNSGKRSDAPTTNPQTQNDNTMFDIVIVGGGAAGLFATGAALSFGSKTLLLDQGNGFVGGDCSNAACVPSKALRSIARLRRGRMEDAQQHVRDTVLAVRNREDIRNFENVTNLQLVLVESSKFVSHQEMEILPRDGGGTPRRIRAKKFLLATGASPIVPVQLEQEASLAGLPLFTYRDVLMPERQGKNADWNKICCATIPPNIVIAGGGPTAVELGQALCRLGMKVTIAAPTILSAEDVSLQKSAIQILRRDGAKLFLGRRVVGVNATNKDVILDDGSQLMADALLVCIGRQPTVKNLDLDTGGIAFDVSLGVKVRPSSLQSCSNPRVFACGDCCSAVQGKDRKAAHAAWTGYFAIRNMCLPKLLWWGSTSVHGTVPSVTYADPELASVGMTRSECLDQYGRNGFVYQAVREEGNDRADMERRERFVDPCFVELRAERRTGRILGLTACGPAAAELANEVGLAIQTKLTVRDLAQSIHSYPSHGYLLYRLSLSLALSSVRGFLDTLGPLCIFGGKIYGGVSAVAATLNPVRLLPWKRAKRRQIQHWEAYGEKQPIMLPLKVEISTNASETSESMQLPMSFLDFYESKKYLDVNRDDLPESFVEWLDQKLQ